MFRWIPYAMVRVTIFYVAGVSVAINFPLEVSFWLLFAITILYLAIRSGYVGLLAIFLFGFARVGFHVDDRKKIKTDFYQVTLTRYAEERENSWRIEAEFNKGNILLYFPKVKFKEPFHYGDVLLIRGTPSLVKPPTNPGEFNFQRHLYFKNIHYQHYVVDAKLIDSDRGNPFISSAIKVRLWSDQQLKKYVHGDREQATASALVLGVTDGLDSDLLLAYSQTGAMHVLAVSGLHVSIIYWIILLLGKPVEKLRSGKAILAVGSVVLLWIYAFVTGWSPSVLRAVMMFTFVALARPWKQSTNIYNTMAASAFCLLIYDPFFLMSVGFQLSYIAVFGIVFIHPHLYTLWEPRNRILDEIWKVTSVSVAAQIATVPISLFYFHQFPNYFLIANLLVIPASFVVLVAGLAVLPLAIVPILAKAVGFILQWTIYLMNSIILIIGDLPFAVIRGIYLDGTQALLLAGITSGVLFCMIFKNIRWLWMSFAFTICFSVIDWIHLNNVVTGNHITVYNIPKKTALDLISHNQSISYGEFNPFHMSANRVQLGATTIKQTSDSLISWKGLRILVGCKKIPINIPVDILIISNNSVDSIPPIKCRKVIIDSSNSFYLAERLLRQPVPADIEVYSVLHKGAFQFSF
jgi:competence protein ComEC